MRPASVVADVIVELEAVAPAGDQHVVVAVGAQFHRAIQPPRRYRGDAGEQRRLRFLAAETTAHAPAFHQHRMRCHAQRMGHHMLHLAGVLGRAVHAHAVAFKRHGIADLAFQVELFLPALHEAALQPMRRRGDGALAGAWRRFPRQVHRRHHVGLRGMRLAHRQHRRQRFDVDEVLGPRRGTPRRVARARNHREHRLAQVVHLAAGQDRVVVHDRAALVLARDVFGRDHVDHARQGAQRVQSNALEPAVGQRRQAQRAVQRAGQLGQVVDVGGGAGDVQVRRLVRVVASDHAGGVLRAGAGLEIRGEVGACGLVHGLGFPSQALAVRAWSHTLARASGCCVRVCSHIRLSKPRATWRR